MSKSRVIALIPARGGSKGLPRKNICALYGKPLIAWTIEAALKSKHIDKVVVSSEDLEIQGVSKEYGAEIISRPVELASDISSSESVISHAIEYIETEENATIIVLLQPTSPLRTAEHVDNAFEYYLREKANSVIGVFEPKHTPVKSYIENKDGSLSGLYSSLAPYTRRQDLPRAFQPNGAIYIFSVVEFKKHNQIPREKVYPYIMSEQDSVDIDTLEDLVIAETFLKSKNNE